MSVPLLNAAGRRRAPVTLPGYLAGRTPRNKGLRYPPDPPTVEEIVAVMRQAGDGIHGARMRALVVMLWRAGLRITEALTLTEHDLEPGTGSVLVRHGKGGRRREVGTDPWGFEHHRPWLELRMAMPVGPRRPGCGAASRPTSCATRTRSSSPTRATGRDGLIWPHCDGLIWPHLRPIGGRRFELCRARAGGAGGDGIEGGAVRADQARPRSGGTVDPGVGGALRCSSACGQAGVGLAAAAGAQAARGAVGAQARCVPAADRRLA